MLCGQVSRPAFLCSISGRGDGGGRKPIGKPTGNCGNFWSACKHSTVSVFLSGEYLIKSTKIFRNFPGGTHNSSPEIHSAKIVSLVSTASGVKLFNWQILRFVNHTGKLQRGICRWDREIVSKQEWSHLSFHRLAPSLALLRTEELLRKPFSNSSQTVKVVNFEM
jgi:hypothetical protein